MFVKVCGLANAEDVAVACAAGADAVGFVFAESPRQISIENAVAACSEIRSGVLRVAVMRHPTQALVDDVLSNFKPDVLQTDVEDLDGLTLPKAQHCWPVYRQGISEPRDVPEHPLSTAPPLFLYEGQSSGSGEPIDWALAVEHADAGRLVLAGGLTVDNVQTAIRRAKPYGVDVSSGVESRRGQKDHEKIYAFVNAAKAAQRNP